MDIYLIFILYKNTLRLLKNKPVIVLTNEFIEVNEDKESKIYNWSAINNIGIENDRNDSKGNYLIIETGSLIKRLNLNWLEKSPNQIIELINNYKKPSH